MRLIRLKLNDWRGIVEREVTFDQGVTIVEGPNEIGKSSIVEALFLLIHEFASTSKVAVKAVQPMGQDVGSTVEAEIAAGDWHFVYSKTFNKGKKAQLNILAPKNSQLAGREAHERVLELLGETVDLDLWKALLVDQGGQLAPVNLKDSEGLSNALDAAAAGSDATGEDVALLDAARAEYEQYFTLKTGQDRLATLEKELEQAESVLAAATDDLRRVEDDAESLQRLDADLRRRQGELPGLQNRLEEYAGNKQAADKIGGDLQLASTQVAAAQERQRSASVACAERRQLAEEIAEGEKALKDASESLSPLQTQAQELDAQMKRVNRAVEDKTTSVRDKRRLLEVARDEEAHLKRTETLAQQQRLAERIDSTQRSLERALDQVAAIAIDEPGFDALRQAENDLRVIERQRSHAATRVSVTATTDLGLIIGDASVDLPSGQTQEREVASALRIELPGLAEVRITPPQSVADLDDQVNETRRSLTQALTRYGIGTLDEARTALAKKLDAQQEAQRLKSRLSDLLGDVTVQELQQAIARLQADCDHYLAARDTALALPEDGTAARRALDAAQRALNDEEQGLETARLKVRTLRNDHEQADRTLRDAQNQQSRLEATLNERKRRLESARGEISDEDLAVKREQAAQSVAGLTTEVDRLTGELEQLSPDTIDALFDNASSVLRRAETELAAARQQRAVFEDRLTRAKADGRFETCEAAERRRDQLRDELRAKRQRAAAAGRLWETLNRHRNAARQAYVRPLKAAIERLGRIVFGGDFQISVDDDWSLAARTLDGITLPYEALSVGAQEQLGILTRLAAAQIVSSQGGVPLIIDDALGFSDPGRLETMGAAIAAAGKTCQVIILTCSPGRFTHVGNASVVRLAQ